MANTLTRTRAGIRCVLAKHRVGRRTRFRVDRTIEAPISRRRIFLSRFASADSLTYSYLYSLTGEGVQSAFHLFLNLFLIRTLHRTEYGMFAVAFTVGAASILYCNALFGIPAKVYIPRASAAAAKVLHVGLGSAALVACIGLTFLVTLGGWYWWGALAEAGLAGVFIGLWALRSYRRSALLAHSRSKGAALVALSDIAYSLTGACCLGAWAIFSTPALGLPCVFALLCLANMVGILSSWRQPLAIRVSMRKYMLKQCSRLWTSLLWSLIGVAAASVQGLALSLAVSGWGGPGAYAPIAAGLVIVSPVRVVATALTGVLVVDLANTASNAESVLNKSTVWVTALCLSIFCLAYGGVLVGFWPILSNVLYAKNFDVDPMGMIVSLAWLAATLACLYWPLVALVQAMLRFQTGALCILAGAVVGAASVVVLLVTVGPPASIGGVVIGELVILLCIWISSARINLEHCSACAGLAGRIGRIREIAMRNARPQPLPDNRFGLMPKTPRVVEFRIDRASARDWQLQLLELIGSKPNLRARVRWMPASDPCPRWILALLSFERAIFRRQMDAAARIDAAAFSRYLGEHSGVPDHVVDFCGSSAENELPTWFVQFDGRFGEAGAMRALLAGRFPLVEIVDAASGRVVASARPGTETCRTVSASLAHCLDRTVIFLAKALEGTISCASGAKQDKMQSSRDLVQLGRYGIVSLADQAKRAVYHSLFHAPHWRVGWRFVTGPGVLDLLALPNARWNRLPDDGHHFYADPFPFVWKNRTFLFVEDFDHRLGRGVISAVEFDEHGPLGAPKPVLCSTTHLSYPFVFSAAGEVWMVPETSGARTIDLYRATSFPDRWQHHTTLVCGTEASDATLFKHGGRWWMTATVTDGAASYSDALYLWSAESFHGPWAPHRGNPVLIDIASARPAGRVTSRNGRLLRPVQDCRGGYGVALGLAEITRLDEDCFEQSVIALLRPGKSWPGRRIHTVNRAGRLECIDGSGLSPRTNVRSAIDWLAAASNHAFAHRKHIYEGKT